MAKAGPVTGTYSGERTYTGRTTFAQGASGSDVQITMGSSIWYVDKGKSTGVTGGGTTWDDAFLTITEAVAAAGNDDVIYIGYGTYAEAATIAITQHGLRIIGINPTRTFGGVALITTTCADDLMTINANRVEVTGLTFFCNTNAKSGIVFGETYDPWHCYVHNCYFGYSGQDGAGGEYGIKLNETNDCSDTIIENCTFHDLCTAGIVVKATRSRIENCIFQIYTGKIGIHYEQTGHANPDGVCLRNYMIGWGSGCTGIEIDNSINAGRLMIADNKICNCTTVAITTDKAQVGIVQNQAPENATTYLGIDG